MVETPGKGGPELRHGMPGRSEYNRLNHIVASPEPA
jgi:hypothetical protein